MFEHAKHANGFIAALDQSGGSTPKALRLYGIEESQYSNDDEMFDLIHEMRTRIMTSPAFNGERVLGAILFENTMDRQVEGRGSAEYLWDVKGVVPFLKVDKGLADEVDGAQVMKPMPDLDASARAGRGGRRVRYQDAVVDRPPPIRPASTPSSTSSSRSAARSSGTGWCRSSSPRSTSTAPARSRPKQMLRARISEQLDSLDADQNVMLKLSIPTVDDFYVPLIEHPASFVSWRCRAATRATTPTIGCRATTA